MKKTLKFLDEHLEEIICVVVLAAMTVVIFLQIILRAISTYVFVPMAWTEEIGRYLFIWAVYVGAAYATHKRAHQKVDVLPLLFGDTGKLVFSLIGDIGLLVFSGVVTIYAWDLVREVAFEFVQRAPSTKINMGIPYAGPALGMTLCAFRSIENIFVHIRDFVNLKKGTKKIEGGDNQ